ncbi:MAG: caspase family protein [Pseudomonadota bacterium]
MRIQIAILGIAALAISCVPAFADKRVALIIGNSAYQNVTALPNPTNDAAAMTATLKSAGFDVVDSRRDLKANEMRRALRDFSDTARDADVAVVYYAGHGIEIDGINYLIPVDASLERDIDAFDEAIPLDRILTVMEPAKQLRLAILDACRDNPFNKTMKRTIGSRAVTRGLAKVEPTSPNTLIAFAAKAGSTASDGDKNSPFTAALVKYLPRPGLDLRKAFGFVRDDVLKVTNNRQEPFVYGSLGGNDVTLVPAVTPAPAASSSPSDQNAAARRDYELAERVGTKAVWDYFITTYPAGLYTELAKAQRDKLAAEAARLAATEKAKAAQEEQTRLAVEGAKAAAQAKAAADAKAAEQARVAAELAKKAEEAKVAEAERAKAEAQAKAAEEARAKAEKPVGPVAALTPPDQTAQPSKADAPIAVGEIPKLLLAELRRVGCNTGAIGDSWNPAAQKAMELFNKNAGMKLDVKVASVDSLDAVKSKQGRICPLICERGYKADGDRCSKIVCKAGYEVGSDNNCEKIEAKKPAPPVAKRDDTPKREDAQKAPKTAAKPATGGMQTICSFEIQGCRQVNKGCRASASGTEEICN